MVFFVVAKKSPQLLPELPDVDDEAFVGAVADQGFTVIDGHFEDDTPAIDFDNFRLTTASPAAR